MRILTFHFFGILRQHNHKKNILQRFKGCNAVHINCKGMIEALLHRMCRALQSRDNHCPVCQWNIRQDSEFSIGYGYPKTTFKRQQGMNKGIRNAFVNISRIKILGKSSTLHNHSFSIFGRIFSDFCASTPSLYMV